MMSVLRGLFGAKDPAVVKEKNKNRRKERLALKYDKKQQKRARALRPERFFQPKGDI